MLKQVQHDRGNEFNMTKEMIQYSMTEEIIYHFYEIARLSYSDYFSFDLISYVLYDMGFIKVSQKQFSFVVDVEQKEKHIIKTKKYTMKINFQLRLLTMERY